MREMSFSDILLKELLAHLSLRNETQNFMASSQFCESICPTSAVAETTLTWLSAHISPKKFSSSQSVKSYKSQNRYATPQPYETRAQVVKLDSVRNSASDFYKGSAELHIPEEKIFLKQMDAVEILALASIRELGFSDLDESADFNSIKTQFRRFARKYHPDLVRALAPEIQKERAEIFQQIKPSFDVLLAWATK